MLISAGAFVPTFSNYMFAGTNIDSYIGALTGLGIIVTAIVHPEGIAPFFGDGVRHAGNWLVGAIPGAETIRAEYRGARGAAVKAFMAVLVIGTALFLYNAKFIENVYLWVAFTAVLVWVIILIAAVVLGGIAPTFGEAGAAWVGWARRFGPTALAGYVAGWLIWPIRVDTYSKLWMPLLGAGIALFIRSIVRQIRGVAGDDDADQAVGEGGTPTEEQSTEASLVGVN